MLFFIEKILEINKIYKSIKGISFIIYTVIVATGDLNGGIGIGRAKSIDQGFAVYRASLRARKNFFKIILKNNTISHAISGKFCNVKILLFPGRTGYNICSGSCTREIFEIMGISSIVSKIYGSGNIWNVSQAALRALLSLESSYYVSLKRNKSLKIIYEK